MKKKTLGVIAFAGATVLMLSGCGQGDGGSANGTKSGGSFDTVKMEYAPQWDVENLVQGSWGSGNPAPAGEVPTENPNPEETAPANETPDPIPADPGTGEEANPDDAEYFEPPADVFLQDQVSFYDTSTKCRITGLVGFSESYKEKRGDLFNSKDYLYAQVAPSQNVVAGETTQNINGTEYVVGNFDTPVEWSETPYHRMAVRVFSTPISLGETGDFGQSELGNFNSDLSKGLPMLTIDYACPTVDLLTDAQWEAGIKNFKAIINPKPIEQPTVDPNAPVEEGQNPVETTQPTDPNTDVAPTEGATETEAPADETATPEEG